MVVDYQPYRLENGLGLRSGNCRLLNALLPMEDREWMQDIIFDIAAATIVPQSKVQSMVKDRIFDYATLLEVVAGSAEDMRRGAGMNWLRCWFKITGHNIERAGLRHHQRQPYGERYGDWHIGIFAFNLDPPACGAGSNGTKPSSKRRKGWANSARLRYNVRAGMIPCPFHRDLDRRPRCV